MKKALLFITAAAAVLAGCAKSEVAVPDAAPATRTVTIKATAEGINTKVSFAEDKTFGWQAGDAIGFYVYDHTEGLPEADARIYTAGYFAGTPGSAEGAFDLSLGENQDYYKVSWYPWVASNGSWTDAGIFTYDAYSEITIYDADLLDARYMPMLAYFPDDENKDKIEFKNIGALVKVSLTNVPAEAKYFKLVADKQISGPFTLDLAAAAPGTDECVLTPQGAGANSVQFTFDGITAPSTLDLYFPVPTGEFKFGIEVYGDGTTIYKKEITSESTVNTITRGTILRMPVIDIPAPVVKSEYTLIGWFNDVSWNTDVDLIQVEGETDWFVAENIASRDGNIQFKFRKNASWADADVIGALRSQNKELDVLIPLAQPGEDITYYGNESYDIYFNGKDMKCFILVTGSPFVVPSTEEVEYIPASAYTITGSLTEAGVERGWGYDVSLSKVSGSEWFVAENIGGVGGKLDFKFRKDASWDKEVGAQREINKATGVVFPLIQRELGEYDGTGHDIIIIGTGPYDIYFNETTMEAFILDAGTAFSVPSTVETDPVPDPTKCDYSMIGSFFAGGVENGWSFNVDMYQVGSTDWYVAEDISARGSNISFKFRKGSSWADSDVYGGSNPKEWHKALNTLVPLTHGGNDIILDGTGTYDVYFNETTMQTFILNAGDAFAVPTDEEQAPAPITDFSGEVWTFVGSFSSWNQSDTNYDLVWDATNEYFKLEHVTLSGSIEFKFVKDHSWSTEYTANATVSEGVEFNVYGSGSNSVFAADGSQYTVILIRSNDQNKAKIVKE